MAFTSTFNSLRRTLVVWLAVWTAVFGALGPTVSHAVAGSQEGGAPWTEVCTDAGMRWVDPTTGQTSTDSPDGQESSPSLVHCPFCLLFTDRVAPAPHALVHLFAMSGEQEAPTIRQVFLFLTYFAPTPPPRGPPELS